MATKGGNEGFRVLDEFVCTALPGPGLNGSNPAGRGENAGMGVVTELVIQPPLLPVNGDRIAALRSLSSAQLLALVHDSAAKLSSQDLLAIHDIAAERWSQGSEPPQAAIELSREAMRVAVNRCA